MKLLVVDDEPNLCAFLKTYLEENGHETVTASGVKEAIEFLKKDPLFEIVISDIKMPQLDGEDLLDYVRAHCGNIKKFFFMSAFHDFDEKRLLSKGATKIFSKPLEVNEIISYL